ncbi:MULTISPECIES: hypothetical protein [unclassified Lentimonas]|uniref:hypothetical protein n=1 Tax=unclassified Lentimonas TaxID=2630993 RepID=UPI001329A60A|nr:MULTISPECIES: hypothetical protein [unclassified Lentimonas]CAA6694617.1 Unannotated [Lentimonas sp. CC19]CAA6696539.1 Unannotated [Lentimonas sp. CC10]CAA7071366.1 Unannotated [Lentimonas sp. CC11]
MTNKAQFSIVALVLGGLLLLLCLTIPKTHFSTSVIDLLPMDTPEVDILREMADLEQGKQITVRLYSDSGSVDSDVVDAFLSQLQASEAIDDAWIAGEDALLDVGAYVFERRLSWLLPQWLDLNFPEWRDADSAIATGDITAHVVDELDRFLQSPESIYLSDTIGSDPFLLLAHSLESVSLFTSESEGDDVFLWVKQTHSPFSDLGQEPVFQALDEAFKIAQGLQPELRFEYSGISRFANESKVSIKKEIQLLNLFGLLFVFAISAFFVQDLRAIIRIVFVVIAALLTAVVTVVIVFPAVHIIALVIGSILTGIAVDYGFHLILKEKQCLPRRTVIKAVVTGALSSSMGFVVLLWAPLPFLQQVGVFVSSGLFAALLMALLLSSSQQSTRLKYECRISPFRLPWWTGPTACLLLLPGLFQLQWKDSITDLEYPLPELKALETRLREDSSPLTGSRVYLVHAEDIFAARIKLAELVKGAEQDSVNAGGWVPVFTDAQQAQVFFSQRDDLVERLSRELEQRGYRFSVFAPFVDDWSTYVSTPVTVADYKAQVDDFANRLPGPLSNFVHSGTEIAWYMAVLPEGAVVPETPGVLLLDQGDMLSEAFSEYRHHMLYFAGVGLLLLILGVLISYGLVRGAFSLAITMCAVLAAVGVGGYLGGELGLFHLVGGLVAFCISLDYALFAVESHWNQHRLPASITISALTTGAVFGLLALSHIPAVSQFAVTVLLLISMTLLLIAAGWPLLKRRDGLTDRYLKRLPHGEAAVMVERIDSVDEKTIQTRCIASQSAPVVGEALVEAMAQSAAAWLAYVKEAEEGPRSGMLVLVQNCDLNERALPAVMPYQTEVVALSEAQDGLIFFEGKCQTVAGILLCEARFSVYVEGEESAT